MESAGQGENKMKLDMRNAIVVILLNWNSPVKQIFSQIFQDNSYNTFLWAVAFCTLLLIDSNNDILDTM